MFTRTAIIAAILLFAAAASAQIYKWVDEDGVVHYSDQPAPGAEILDLPDRPARAVAPPAPARSSLPDNRQPAETAPRAFGYETLRFTSPTAEQTLWNIGGVLEVTVNVQPALRPSDTLRVYFDGEPMEVSGQRFQLEEVWRGTHNLQAEVVDVNGQLMIRSEPLRFYVQQTSVAN